MHRFQSQIGKLDKENLSRNEAPGKGLPKEIKKHTEGSNNSKQQISENDVFMTECSDLDKMFQSGALKKR